MHLEQNRLYVQKKIFLYFGFLALFLLSSCHSQEAVTIIRDDYATQVSNYNNFSYMVESNGKIYFPRINEANSDLYSPDFDKVDAGIYVMDADGENIEKISDMYGRFLQVAGDKLYFNTWLPEPGLYRMNLDGSNLELMVEGVWLSFFVYEDAIYYVADMYHPFRKYDLKTGETTTVLDDFGSIKWIDDGYLYFSYDHDITTYHSLNLETKEIQPLKNSIDITPQRFSYDGNSIFYSTHESIHRITLNSTLTDETLVNDISDGSGLIRNGAYFYYFTLRPEEKNNLVFDLYRVDERGRNKEILVSGLDQRTSMYIVGGNLYLTRLAENTSLIIGYDRFNLQNNTLESLAFPED